VKVSFIRQNKRIMDKIDSQILQELQYDFPLSERPYEVIAERLEISKDEIWNRVQMMLDNGIIRRMGASFDSNKLGFRSTLVAVSVASELVDRAAEIIGRFYEVTHSYLRNDVFNIWFTLIAVDDNRIEKILEQIRKSLSLERSEVLNLPMTRLFKLDARFHVQ
jgi:DNA-binding Lrp family transcriptional regulator